MEPVSEPISVTILDREYQFACRPEERKALREAADYLHERMLSIKGEGRLMALERIAVMTALNLSDELLKMQKLERHRKQNVDKRIRMLADELEDALEDQLG
ncbi:MAG: cell division protein ZapA [Gammaproteobacteria bacterium]|jgi:cell division protein ZapA|nr:MAG: cell division protein ZapA [Gammaproteobacteria bacterium]